MERYRFAHWRSRLTDRIVGDRALEVGVGTGKNLSYYPRRVKITAINFSRCMLERAYNLVTLRGFVPGDFVQPFQISTPPSFTFGRLWLQIFVGVCFKSLSTGFCTEIVCAHFISQREISLVRRYFHKADRVYEDIG